MRPRLTRQRYLCAVQEAVRGGVGGTAGLCDVHHGHHGEAQARVLRHYDDVAEVHEETHLVAQGANAGTCGAEEEASMVNTAAAKTCSDLRGGPRGRDINLKFNWTWRPLRSYDTIGRWAADTITPHPLKYRKVGRGCKYFRPVHILKGPFQNSLGDSWR